MCKQIFAIYIGPSTHAASGAETGYSFGPPVFTPDACWISSAQSCLFSVK